MARDADCDRLGGLQGKTAESVAFPTAPTYTTLAMLAAGFVGLSHSVAGRRTRAALNKP